MNRTHHPGTTGLGEHILGELGFSPAAVCNRSRAATRWGTTSRKHPSSWMPSTNQPTNRTLDWLQFLGNISLFRARFFFDFSMLIFMEYINTCWDHGSCFFHVIDVIDGVLRGRTLRCHLRKSGLISPYQTSWKPIEEQLLPTKLCVFFRGPCPLRLFLDGLVTNQMNGAKWPPTRSEK